MRHTMIKNGWAPGLHWWHHGGSLLEAIWRFPYMDIYGVPANGWFIKKNSIKTDDLGIPLLVETSMSDSSQYTTVFAF